MGTFDTSKPARLVLASWEAAERARNIAASGSPSPSPFAVVAPPAGSSYTHLGRDAQYGRGRRNGRTARLVIVHTTESDTFTGSMSYGARRADSVSSTAYVGPAGEIGAAVPEADRSFTTGRWNDESLAIEVVGRAGWSAEQWRARPKQLAAIVDLLVDYCRRHNIPANWLPAAYIAAGASRHGTTPVAGVHRGITDHLEANLAARLLGASHASTSHWDVGPGLRSVLVGSLIPLAAARLAAKPVPPIKPPPPTTWSPPMTALHMADPEPRIVDTRHSLGMRRPVADSTFAIPIPAEHAPTAAVLTVTTVNPAGGGYLALWGDNPGETSKLNYAPGDPSPRGNTTLVAVGRDAAGKPVVRGAMRVSAADLIVDLVAVIS